MRRTAKLTALLMVTGVAAAPAQKPAAPNYGPITPLVGHCWIGAFPDGKQTDEHCFEWVFDHKFIRDRHVVRGGAPYQGESVYHWDAKAGRLAYDYWSSEGFVLTGLGEYTSDGIVFDGEIRAVWTTPTAAGYKVTQSQKKDGAWKELWSMEMKLKS